MSRCPYCQAQLLSRKGAKTCGLPSCRQANKAIASRESHRREAERRKADKLSTVPPRVIVRRPADTPDAIEARFQQARAARLARERATGVREHTITTGWMQKSGGRPYVAAEGEGW